MSSFVTVLSFFCFCRLVPHEEPRVLPLTPKGCCIEDQLKLPRLLQILNISDSTGFSAKMVVNSPTQQFFQLDSNFLVSFLDIGVVGLEWG